MSRLMTVKEAAQYLRLNYMTVYKLAQRGKVPAFKIGGNWRLKKEMVDEWLVNQSRIARGVVLVVDDDSRVRNMLEDIISEHGYEVTTVGSGEKAIEEVERRHFDLIFLDLVLPGLSGVEVLHIIKAKDKKAVAVIITGYGDDPIALEAMALGPLLLIRKPFHTKDVVEVLDIVLGVRKSAITS
jgi:excisionase family DNA binding protein